MIRKTIGRVSKWLARFTRPARDSCQWCSCRHPLVDDLLVDHDWRLGNASAACPGSGYPPYEDDCGSVRMSVAVARRMLRHADNSGGLLALPENHDALAGYILRQERRAELWPDGVLQKRR